ncbi:AMP-dependent synthetase/ligase [Nocardia arizonensis]|uniref:AMP-dependent synthetase/ligase n=1 Tax=Nocardia arizonensis TaxID=1141647 RepID=UPI0023B7B6B2|nr:AMP-dependent synthetase/ligase [Nocardia arizonensis]
MKPTADVGLADMVFENAARSPADSVFSCRTAGGWRDIAATEFADVVRRLAKGLVAAGIRAGDRVLVLGNTSYEWSAVDFALLSVGAVTVPVYPTSSPEQIRHILEHSRPSACFAETDTQLELVGEAIATRWLLGSSFDELIEHGRVISDDVWERRRAAVRADDLATIVYTSGTTGVPKGCMLTHRNIFTAAANVVRLLDEVFCRERGETLLFLPLAHVYGRVTQFACVWAGVRTGLVGTPGDLIRELPSFRPTFLVGVPHLLEKIRKLARQVVGETSYDMVEKALIAKGHAERYGTEVGSDATAGFDEEHRKLRDIVGGSLEYIISGGASLEPSTADFFAGLGVEILGAYGLTEASSTVSMSAPDANRPDAVGRPAPGTTIAISPEGEILVRGDQVFAGYWPDGAGRDASWLATGDLGRLDDDGFLYITGRRREIIVTSGGKNVAPAPLEDRIRLHPLVNDCMLVGEGRPYVTALITVDVAALSRWAADRDLDCSLGVPTGDSGLIAEIATAVEAANKLVSRAESIRRFAVLPEDFSAAKGQVTASLRLRRAVIEEDFRDTIATLYPR